MRLPELLDLVETMVATGGSSTVGYVNAHVLNQAARDAELADFLRQLDLCYCDGNGVRLAARMLGASLPERMTGADWIWDLARRAEGHLRLHWVAGAPGVTEEAAQRIRARHPRLHITTDHGFHDKEGSANDALIDEINATDPDIVLVGMGTPLQEHWVAANRHRIQAPVVWVLGATADFVAGVVPRPGPAWLVDHAEWLSRLAADPRRLAGRYLFGNAEFLARVARQRLRSA